jgi:hypothetical protein
LQCNYGMNTELSIMLQNTWKWEHYKKQVA